MKYLQIEQPEQDSITKQYYLGLTYEVKHFSIALVQNFFQDLKGQIHSYKFCSAFCYDMLLIEMLYL